jgi:hypothetical protein
MNSVRSINTSLPSINQSGIALLTAGPINLANATVGIYYWKHGSDYVKYAEDMIKKDIRTNNEFYVCPVYNEAIQDVKQILNFEPKVFFQEGINKFGQWVLSQGIQEDKLSVSLEEMKKKGLLK